jgi:tol-pal system protein YbgF
MRKGNGFAVAALSVALLSSGCATAGGAPSGSTQVQNTVYETHRIVQDLSGSVSTVTQTTASISARMDSNEQEMRRLVSMAEENQRKLEGIQFTLDQLVATLYQQLNLSPPTRLNIPPQPGLNPDGVPQQPGVEVRPPAPQPQITPPLTPPPVIAPPETTRAPVDAKEHYRVAQQYFSDDDYAMALKQFDDHIATYPDSPYVANATYWRALCQLKTGDYSEAIKGFDDFRSKYGSSGKIPVAMHNEAVAYSRLGQKERAKALFQQLIREYPDDVATEGARENLRKLQGLGQ